MVIGARKQIFYKRAALKMHMFASFIVICKLVSDFHGVINIIFKTKPNINKHTVIYLYKIHYKC